MTKRRLRAAALALATVCLLTGAVSAAKPAEAVAFQSWYSCSMKPPNQWCDGRANGTYDGQHSYDMNSGAYPGPCCAVTVCQRVYKPSTGGVLAGSNCGVDATGFYYGNVQCICYDAEILQQSGGNHSIDGYAEA
jgi:hypothetical protein